VFSCEARSVEAIQAEPGSLLDCVTLRVRNDGRCFNDLPGRSDNRETSGLSRGRSSYFEHAFLARGACGHRGYQDHSRTPSTTVAGQVRIVEITVVARAMARSRECVRAKPARRPQAGLMQVEPQLSGRDHRQCAGIESRLRISAKNRGPPRSRESTRLIRPTNLAIWPHVPFFFCFCVSRYKPVRVTGTRAESGNFVKTPGDAKLVARVGCQHGGRFGLCNPGVGGRGEG